MKNAEYQVTELVTEECDNGMEGTDKGLTSAMQVRIIRQSLPLWSRCSSANKQEIPREPLNLDVPQRQYGDQEACLLGRIEKEVKHQLCIKVQNYDPRRETIRPQISVKRLLLQAQGLFGTVFLFASPTLNLS